MSGHGMGQHVCQIPGCETTHSEIESELQTYLSGFCQVNRGIVLVDAEVNEPILYNFVTF